MRRSHLARAGRLVLRRLAVIVLCAFVASLASATVGQLWHAFAGADQVAHSDGAPCPDPSDRDHPCGPACACACCHAQAAISDLQAAQPSEWLPAFTAINGQLNDDFHPKEVAFRIFHPPRA